MNKEFSIEKGVVNEIEIKKSKFICHIKPISSRLEAEDFIKVIRKENPNAAHNCPAFIVDNVEYASDDGEPTHTAGLPILNVLQKKKLNNIVCVVTRYFGGTKLGTGGLVKAYSQAVIDALEYANINELVNALEFDIVLKHNDITKVKSILQSYNISVLNETYESKVKIHIKIDEDLFEKVKQEIINFNYLINFENINKIKIVRN